MLSGVSPDQVAPPLPCSPASGASAEALSSRFGVHVTTARRWLRGSLPPPVWLALAVLRFGRLGLVDQAWNGWTLQRGELVSPEGDRWSPNELRYEHYQSARVLEMSRLIEDCRRREAPACAAQELRAAQEAMTALESAAAAAQAAVRRLGELRVVRPSDAGASACAS